MTRYSLLVDGIHARVRRACNRPLRRVARFVLRHLLAEYDRQLESALVEMEDAINQRWMKNGDPRPPLTDAQVAIWKARHVICAEAIDFVKGVPEAEWRLRQAVKRHRLALQGRVGERRTS